VPPGLTGVVALAPGSIAFHAMALRKQSSAPVAWLNSDNTFNGNIQVNGDVHVAGEITSVNGFRLNDGDLWLRRGNDRNNGLGWYGTNKPFAGGEPDGPVLFGFNGGRLGTTTNGQKVAISWDSSQQVGIGTTIPRARLSLGSDLADTKLFLFDESDGNGMGLGVQNSQFRLHLSGTSDRFSFLSSPGGTELLTINGSGNVGIGTNTPTAKLQVKGDIKLGTNGALFAVAGPESLRILRGVVNSVGTNLFGAGYTVAHTGAGAYTLTFATSFADVPAVTVTAQSGASFSATCTSVSAGSAGIRTWAGNVATDNQFDFIAIGPK
jgi:hypothetical protein